MDPKYSFPREHRRIDTKYVDALKKVLAYGEYTKNPFQTEGTYTCLTIPAMEFCFQNGFPIVTERKIGFWRKPIQELFAFVNGVRDARVLAEDWGVNWWMEKWATPPKCEQFKLAPYDMGDGSYGPGFNPTLPDGTVFRQFEHLIKQIKKYPDLRTHRITTWIPQYCLQHENLVRKVVVAPCHGDIQITILNGKMTLRMDQRSDDLVIGHPANMIQYAAITLAIASLTGYEPYMFIHAPHDCQIYERHLEDARELIKRPSHVFPEMYLTEEGKKLSSIFDFRAKHFELRNYESEPAMTLPEAVV